MIIDSPLPFREALSIMAHKDLLPTNMSSAELRTLDKSIRERSFFSAQTFMENYLESVKDKVQKILNPESAFGGVTGPQIKPVTVGLDYATARTDLKGLLKEMGYAPEDEKLGSIEDLASDARLNLLLKTNVEMAQGYGNWRQGQDETVLDQWPAQELYRAEDRDTPRGTKHGKGGLIPDPENSWQSRWNEAGEASGQEDGWGLFGHRMIDLNNHPIWEQLGSSELFDDGLDNPYPPFAFNSGMDVRDIGRDEAISLGLIDENTQIEPQVRPFELEEAA